MGYGDFKLLGMLGAWLGWQNLPTIILLSSVVGAVVGIALMTLQGRDRHYAIPFGPYLAAALTLQLASAVAASDGEFGIKEMGHLRETVLSWKHLTPSQTRRLLAHLNRLPMLSL